ncbi:trypsin-like peptidase domain-containing protein [Streptomyces sp. URMC 123]|uniref:S1C family serine protease n=1 Tax=Streptomyces sp. URMC 123 TaxID=3423403 RepID=UPI003F1DE8D1
MSDDTPQHAPGSAGRTGRGPFEPPAMPIPARPAYAPRTPLTTPDGVTVWPSAPSAPAGPGGPHASGGPGRPGASDGFGPPPGGHGSAPVGHDPAPGHGRRRRRARGPVALIAAVALAAAAIGGGAAALVGEVTSGTPQASGSVDGTNASAKLNGTASAVASAVGPSVVEITAGQGPEGAAGRGTDTATGSGVIIGSGGEILTNNHVIDGASTISVRFADGRKATAKVLGTDPNLDMALIKVTGVSGLKAAELGDSGRLKVGDQVVAFGSPQGLTGTVTSGIVSALGRDVTVRRGGGQERTPEGGGRWPFGFGGDQYNGELGSATTTYKAIQTDASLNPGNSGGPLVNMDGQIIGINSAMYAPRNAAAASGDAGSIGLGFAIPINDVKKVLDKLRGGGARA